MRQMPLGSLRPPESFGAQRQVSGNDLLTASHQLFCVVINMCTNTISG